MAGILDRFRTDPTDPIDIEPGTLSRRNDRSLSFLERFATVEQEPRKPVGLAEEFSAGVSTGVDNVQMMMFGLARLMGRELGITSLEELGIAGVERNALEAQEFAPTIQSFTNEVVDMDTFFRWAAGSLGTQVPILATMFVTGGTGAVLARAAISRQLRRTVKNRMLRNLRRKGITGGLAERAAERALSSEAVGRFGQAPFNMLRDNLVRGKLPAELVREAAKRGATGGVLAASIPLQIAETDITLSEAGIDAGFTSIIAGAIGGALEAVPVLRFLDRAFPGVDRAVSKAFVRDFIRGTGIQLAIESSTEAAQEAIQIAAQAYHDPSFDMLNPENLDRIIDSFAAGALVGGVLGGFGEAIPAAGGLARQIAERVRTERAERRILPTFEMPVDDTESDFTPADNTFFDEVKTRVNVTVKESIEPAMNRIRDTFQEGINQVSIAVPALTAIVGTLTARAQAAHEEFIAGHQHIIDDTTRWAREQAEFITEQAQEMFGPERQQFISKKMAAVKQQVKEVAAILKERADQVVDSLNIQVESIGVFDEESIQVDPQIQFTFGKNRTQGAAAIGFKDRFSARKRLAELRKQFPSATDSTFTILKSETDGTFTVVLTGAQEAEALREDEIVTEAMEAARVSARDNDERAVPLDKRRNASIQRKGVRGRTLLDIKTLVFAGGRRIDAGANQTVAQSFAAVVGRMLDRGIIDNEGFISLKAAFDRQFPGAMVDETLAEAITRDNRILQLKNALTDIPQALLDTPEGQRRITAQRAELNELEQQITPEGDFRTEREIDEAITALDPRADIEEISGEEGDRTDPEADVDEAAADVRRRSRPVTARKPKDRTARKPKKITGEGIADVRDKPRPSLVPKKGSVEALNTGTKVAVALPGVDRTTRKAVIEITERVIKFLRKGARIRIINKEAAQQMVAENHVHAIYAMTLLKLGDFAVATNILTEDGLVYVMVNDFANPGLVLGGLIHELGHAIHFDTWSQLSRANQHVLWDAFLEDVRGGKRTTGAQLNFPGKKEQTFRTADENIFEFKEWMADQFVDWMNNRQAPRSALEKFLESIAVKMDQLWAFMSANPGRFNQPNETYGQFIDAVALGVRNEARTGDNIFFLNEGARGQPAAILANNFGKIVPEGITRHEWAVLKKAIETQYPVIAARAKLMSDWMKRAYHLALAPSTSVMRELSKRVKAADKLTVMFNRTEHGEAKRSKNYHQRLELMKGRFLVTRYDAIAKGMSDSQKASLLKQLRAADGTDLVLADPRAKAIRKLFDEIHAYMIDKKLPVGRINNYFPRTFSREKLIANEERIIKHLEVVLSKKFAKFSEQEQAELLFRDKSPREAARSFYNSLISNEADTAASMLEIQKDDLAMQSPAFRNMRSRTAGDAFFNEFLDDNLDGIMGNYIIAAVKRAEYNFFLGAKAPTGLVGGDVLPKKVWNPRGNLDTILADAKKQGATKEDLQMMKRYVEANLGMYGRDDVSDTMRTAMAAIVAYQNMRVLLFTVFASLPDLVGPAIRSGELRQSFKTVIKNMREIVKTDGEFADMARAFGQVSTIGSQSVLTEYVDNHFMPPTLRKWNEAFFKWTGLNYYTDFTRKMALAVGVDTLKNEARKVNDKTLTQKQRDRAKQFLAEFGIDDTVVNKWVKRGEPVWGAVGYEQENTGDEAIAEALVQFVDESILRPNPSQRPLLASHPAAMLVFHLKGFIYAIHDVVLKRLAHNFRIADTPAQVLAAISPALLMLALTAFGLELRELITGSDRTDRMDGWDYTWTVVERSGLLGISQLGFDFEGADARGQAELAALSGPAIGQLGDLISRPASQTIPKAIPIVSQLPWARDALRQATPL